MKHEKYHLTNQLEFKPPVSAMISFRPGIHHSLPIPRCSCGGMLDQYDWCANCKKWLFDE